LCRYTSEGMGAKCREAARKNPPVAGLYELNSGDP
jgi:hypothetical protein